MANNLESLALVTELYEQLPSLMTRVHAHDRSGTPLFLGESALHIFAVNRRESAFVEMVRLAMASLSLPQAKALFGSLASGLFFAQKPMLFFGFHCSAVRSPRAPTRRRIGWPAA